jgi:hypothetical protein
VIHDPSTLPISLVFPPRILAKVLGQSCAVAHKEAELKDVFRSG